MFGIANYAESADMFGIADYTDDADNADKTYAIERIAQKNAYSVLKMSMQISYPHSLRILSNP